MLQRREFLASTSALAIVPLISGCALSKSPSHPPVARTVDVVDERFGIKLPDPYRWMEDAEDPDWEPFMRGQAAHARAQLDGLPCRERLARRVAELSGGAPLAYKIQRVGEKTFVEFRPAGALSYKLYVVDSPDAAHRLLFDPDQGTEENGAHRSLDYWKASPDGKYIAFGASQAGSEDSVLRLLNVNDGSLLPDELDRAQYAEVAWLPDSSGIFLSRMREGAVRGEKDYYDNSVVWLHQLRRDIQDDLRVVGGGDIIDGYHISVNEFPTIITDPSSEWMLLKVSGAVRRHNPIFLARLDDIREGSAQWRAILTLDDKVTNLALRGDHLYYVSERGAPNGQVLKIDLSTPASEKAKIVAPETEFPIETSPHRPIMVAARDNVYFVRTNGGSNTVHCINADDSLSTLPMPFEAGVYELFADAREERMDAILAGWAQPFGIWRYNSVEAQFVDTNLSPKAELDLCQFESFQITAVARDGTRVPVSVISPRNLKRDGSAPCLVNCYGAYGTSIKPRFNPRVVALLEQGGVYAHVHARGGGEFGSRWWKAGQKETKPNTWRDFIDGCQALFEVGISAPKRLTITGASAGGVAVGRALTEVPDMFAGAILNVAFTNPTRIEAEPSGAAQYVEFGDPNIESEFKALYEMDTYQHVRDGVQYPPVLIMHGFTDSRVSAWQSAKLAARLHKANKSENVVLLRIAFDAGHGPGSTRTQTDERWADMIAFTLQHAMTCQ